MQSLEFVAARWKTVAHRERVDVVVVHTEIARGDRGIVGHVDVTRAFPGSGTHVDPGQTWPWQQYLDLVAAEFSAPADEK
jgi:hypothetical protein